ncbi:MAG: hypothetical protein ABEI76_06690 [Halobacteriales archaeon]
MFYAAMVPQSPLDTDVDGEVTRIDAVQYLEGASGHSVLSLLFLLVGAGLLYAGKWGAGVIAVIIAFGVTLNGLSIYTWDRLRAFFITTISHTDSEDTGEHRTLDVYRPSPEMKAEMLAGIVMVGGFVLGLVCIYFALQLLGSEQVISLLIAGLAIGNVGGLGWSYYTAN